MNYALRFISGKYQGGEFPLHVGREIVIGRGSFPDHHAFTQQELDYLLHQAATENATLVTTPKDSARLSREMRMRIHAAGVDLVWRDAREIDALLTRLLSG